MAILKGRWPDDALAPHLLRAASPPHSLTTQPALGASIVADVIATIGATGAGARLLKSGLQLMFDSYAAIHVPAIEAASSAAAFVGEGQPLLPVRASLIGHSDRCSDRKRCRAEQETVPRPPTKRSKKNGKKSVVKKEGSARKLGAAKKRSAGQKKSAGKASKKRKSAGMKRTARRKSA